MANGLKIVRTIVTPSIVLLICSAVFPLTMDAACTPQDNCAPENIWSDYFSMTVVNYGAVCACSSAYCKAVAVDANGNVVGVGSAGGTDSDLHWLIKKFDPNGTVLWSTTGNGAAPLGVAVDGAGNIVAVGADMIAGGWLVRKYGPVGNLIWSVSDTGTPHAVEIDSNSNIVTAGWNSGWLVRKYDPNGNVLWNAASSGTPYALTIDNNGNVVAAGNDNGWSVKKYDPNGNLLWNIAGTGEAKAVTSDGSGNIIVVGSVMLNGQPDWMIRKYNPSGVLLWMRTYDGPASELDTDSAYAVAVDATGNILVGGTETISELIMGQPLQPFQPFSSYAAASIHRYDPDGTLCWSFTFTGYDGCSPRSGSVNSLAIADSGYFVEGGSAGCFEVGSWHLRKYSLCSQTPSTSDPSSLDIGVAVDPISPIVGQTVTVALTITNTGSTSITGVTPDLQINSGSSLLDLQSGPTPAGPFSIPPGGSVTCRWSFTVLGYGIVTCGVTATGIDSGSGTTVSASIDLELSISPPLELSIAVEPTPPVVGQMIIVALTITNTGITSVTGVIPTLQVDTLLGNSGSSLLSLQSGPTPAGPYSIPAGGSVTCMWIFIVTDYGSVALRVTATGVDLVGTMFSASTDLVLPIFSLMGSTVVTPPLKWSAVYNSSANRRDVAFNVAVDQAGNVIVAGFETLYAGAPYNFYFESWLCRKYTSTGQLLWSVSIGGADASKNFYDGSYAQSVTVDRQGNVICAGYRLESGYKRWVVQKYNPNGGVLWHDFSLSSEAFAVAVDDADNVVAAGVQGPEKEADWLIRKYNSAGILLWERGYNGPANATDKAYCVAIDQDGNIIVVGMQYTSGASEYDWVIRKYDGAGSLLWHKTFNGAASWWDMASEVAVDKDNNIVVVGEEWTGLPPGQRYNWMIRKYTSDGNLIWSRTYGGSTSLHDKPYTVVIDNCGNITVGGYQDGDTSPPIEGGIWLIRQYDPDGNLLPSFLYSGPGGGPDNLYGAAIDGNGDLILAGYESRADLGQGMNWLVRKYVSLLCSKFIQVLPPQPPQLPPELIDLGKVKIVGGPRGYINPKRGGSARILVRPTEAGEIRARIYDEEGALVKEITA